MISTLYRGSVKDLLGPVTLDKSTAVVFEYTDAFSVFDWGRMPDLLSRKGEALAVLAADIFERLEKPETWKEFSKTPGALALRKANRFGSIFNEIGEELQSEGLRTHYIGALKKTPGPSIQLDSNPAALTPMGTSQMTEPFRRLMVKQVSVVKPTLCSVLGRTLPDYHATRNSPLPRLIPLEVVFRMGCPEGSSLRDRVEKDPNYLASLGFPDYKLDTPGDAKWDFPVLELFTKLESSDRPVPLSEALAFSGMSAQQLQDLLLKTAWVSGWLRSMCGQFGLELADGKLEWALDENGKCFLVDAVGPDELRILKDGTQLSKEFLRSFYRRTPWYQAVEAAKARAKSQGFADWKRLVQDPPPPLPAGYRELAIQVYLALTNELTVRKWFSDAWSLKKVTAELDAVKKEISG